MIAHPFDLPQLLRLGVQHRGEGAEVVDEPVGQRVYISLGHGVKEHQLQQLVVVKDPLTVFGEALLQPGPVAPHGWT